MEKIRTNELDPKNPVRIDLHWPYLNLILWGVTFETFFSLWPDKVLVHSDSPEWLTLSQD